MTAVLRNSQLNNWTYISSARQLSQALYNISSIIFSTTDDTQCLTNPMLIVIYWWLFLSRRFSCRYLASGPFKWIRILEYPLFSRFCYKHIVSMSFYEFFNDDDDDVRFPCIRLGHCKRYCRTPVLQYTWRYNNTQYGSEALSTFSASKFNARFMYGTCSTFWLLRYRIRCIRETQTFKMIEIVYSMSASMSMI